MEKEVFEKLVNRICEECDKSDKKLLSFVKPKEVKGYKSVRALASSGHNLEKKTSFKLDGGVTIYFLEFVQAITNSTNNLALIVEEDVELSKFESKTLEDINLFAKIFKYAYKDAEKIVEDFLKGDSYEV